jgi:hypothetical protein
MQNVLKIKAAKFKTASSLVRQMEEHGHHCLHLLVTIWMVLTMQHQWRVVAPVLNGKQFIFGS